MQTWSRWILGTALAADIVFVLVVVAGRWTPTWAAQQEEPTAKAAATETASAAPAPSEWNAAALEALGQQLKARAEELERREAEVAELLRGNEVLRRAGIEPEPAGPAAPAAGSPAPREIPATSAASTPPETVAHTAFQRLQKAYENMEPDSAARALEQLAGKDQQAVVQLLLGWQPRVSGAILDALTQANPVLAADLSYEIWNLSGKPGT